MPRRELLGLLRHPVAVVGAAITTASAVVFIALLIAELAGLFTNPYAGLVVFVALPALFIVGLLLIPIGMRLQRRRFRLNPSAAVDDWPVIDFRVARVRRATLAIFALTAVNIVIVLLAGYGSLHWMESPTFCGQACHTPMAPQFNSWRESVHGGVACVDCHIGEGAAAFAHAKLSGVRQLIQVATNSYPRPIPPGAKMPPGKQAETCTHCHLTGRPSGDRIRVIREYTDDQDNSESTTVLQMHLTPSTAEPRAIHWHADPSIRVEYVATDEERQTIPYVRVTDAKGQVKEFVAPDTPAEVSRDGVRRVMDCIDCHNTVGHPIAPTPEQAVDRAIASGRISRTLPFVRREALRVVKATYPSHDAADAAIERELRTMYTSRDSAADPAQVTNSIAAIKALYRRNINPDMKVTFGSYPDNRGHLTSNGCFRCHDDSHEAKDGSKISGDCEFCHKQLETAF